MHTPLLRIMIQLAQSDGNVSDVELDMIYHIAKSNGIPQEEIKKLLDEPEGRINPGELSNQRKFEYLYNIVLLMKVDDKLFPAEMNFCFRLATKLGYRETVIFELISSKYSLNTTIAEKELIKTKVQQFLL